MQEVQRIALLVGQNFAFCRGVLLGIHAYSVDRPNWVFRDAEPRAEVIDSLKEWRPHGIIVHLYDQDLLDNLRHLKTPIVSVTNTLAEADYPLVITDDMAIGRMAANHFLDRGFTRFGYFGSDWTGFSQLREAGFRDQIQAAGYQLSSCYAEFLPHSPANASWTHVDQIVLDWINHLEKPTAILSSNDLPARQLTDLCRQAGYRVPDDLAILGIDNDKLECLLSRPPLSSVHTPREKIGYEAAKLLDQIMHGATPPTKPILIPPTKVITRQSTDIVAIDDPDVSAAVAYIRDHVADRLSVSNVTEAISLSRRKLERKFKKLLGRTVLEEIQNARVERAKRLLLETDFQMGAVAKRAGFGTSGRMTIVFNEKTGMTPTEFRRRNMLRQ